MGSEDKRKHANDPHHTQEIPGLTDTPQAVYDGAQQPRIGATGWAKAARHWKRTRAQDVMSDSDKREEEGSDDPYSDQYEEKISEGEDLPGKQFPSAMAKAVLTTAPSDETGSSKVQDTKATLLFDPDNLRHPRSAEWEPPEHIAQYLALRVHKSLSQECRNKLRANMVAKKP
ncbi:Hypothetical predicted protein [Pelobates cultripes]|uniref:Uncharacterized protein n=1 Tax=Pelobates cultripes TaxID=61616 RepID=A0AAD1T3K0_PELCU|nr:Hypothetical predicted protein [Pelobates cultripes]